jgi:hypothetical protein
MKCVVSVALVLATFAACNTSDVSRAVGAICESNDECKERCLLPGPDYPDGFCTISCDVHDDCVGGALCVDIDGGICLYECELDVDCEFLGDDWVCRMVDSNTEGQVSVCRGNS